MGDKRVPDGTELLKKIATMVVCDHFELVLDTFLYIFGHFDTIMTNSPLWCLIKLQILWVLLKGVPASWGNGGRQISYRE
jgi:hypothetical protein